MANVDRNALSQKRPQGLSPCWSELRLQLVEQIGWDEFVRAAHAHPATRRLIIRRWKLRGVEVSEIAARLGVSQDRALDMLIRANRLANTLDLNF